jgi:serine/threonine protein kinase
MLNNLGIITMAYWTKGHKIQGGRYSVDRILGSGGAGVTYRAIDQISNQLVAIKTLNAEMQARSDFHKHQERFIQEAFRLAKCSHPHIIQVNDVFQEGALWCMAMEYISGGTLAQYLQYKGVLSQTEAFRYIQQVGSALDYVHQQGFLHRDVKPGNIMLRKRSLEAVLIDFGLARDFVQDKIQVHTNSRTESFAPIEQYEVRAKRGAYTDVYALAATLYFMVTLQLPFPAQFRQQGVNLIPPKKHNPALSDQFNYAILKGMEFAGEARPQSISEWLSLLVSEASWVKELSPAPVPSVITPPSPPQLQLSPPPSSFSPVVKSQSSSAKRLVHYSTPDAKAFTQNSASSPSQTTIAQLADTVALISAVNIDYTYLKELLVKGKWKDADQETHKLMLQVTGRERVKWLDVKHIKSFPCEDLHTIDQLWVNCSSGQFGFTAQKRIYEKLGGTEDYHADVWRNFGDTVGWRKGNSWLKYKDLTFLLSAPEGHLPMLGMEIWGFQGWIRIIACRLSECTQ